MRGGGHYNTFVADQSFPPVYPHGEIREVFPDVFFVTGSAAMPGPLPMRFSRNMTIIRHEGALTVINSMRLDTAGLAALDKLGAVQHVIRLAGFHGMDDPFYKDRYDAKVWVVPGHVYAKGFNAPKTKPEDGYFQPDIEMKPDVELPIPGARLISFNCKAGEGILHLDREGGILVAGDALQNWQSTEYFSFSAKIVMRVMGFIKPHNIGPGWLKGAKPDIAEIKDLLELDFEHVLPVHGLPVIDSAKDKFRPAIDKLR